VEYGEYKELSYGVVKGSNIVLLIKVGSDGSINGYNDKYLNVANKVNSTFGATVIVCSNPHELDPIYNMDITLELVSNMFDSDYQVYYMGHSYGALLGAWYGYKYSEIKRMLLTNGPLMYNLHRFKDGINNFKGERVEIVYGSLDQSIKYTELLKDVLNDIIKLRIYHDEDHHLSGNPDIFIHLAFNRIFYD
jgi:hypothetical protein